MYFKLYFYHQTITFYIDVTQITLHKKLVCQNNIEHYLQYIDNIFKIFYVSIESFNSQSNFRNKLFGEKINNFMTVKTKSYLHHVTFQQCIGRLLRLRKRFFKRIILNLCLLCKKRITFAIFLEQNIHKTKKKLIMSECDEKHNELKGFVVNQGFGEKT